MIQTIYDSNAEDVRILNLFSDLKKKENGRSYIGLKISDCFSARESTVLAKNNHNSVNFHPNWKIQTNSESSRLQLPYSNYFNPKTAWPTPDLQRPLSSFFLRFKLHERGDISIISCHLSVFLSSRRAIFRDFWPFFGIFYRFWEVRPSKLGHQFWN